MSKEEILLEDALLLVEQNFYFFHAGAFFAQISKNANLSHHFDTEVTKTFEDKSFYHFNQAIIEEILNDASTTSATETSFFEYFMELNAVRGITMAMVEALRLKSSFKDFIEARLGENFEDFFDILSFIRNVLSHNVHAQIALNKKDFEGTYSRIVRMKRNPNIELNFNYQKYIPELSAPEDEYGFSCSVDFSTLQTSKPLLDILSLRELFLISEWCFNLTIAYRLSLEK